MAKISAQSSRPKNTKGTLVRTMKYLAPYKFILFVAIVLTLISNVLALLGPKYAGNAINEAAAGEGLVNFDSVLHFVFLMLIVYVVSSILSIVISVIMTSLSKKVACKMRNDVFNKLMKLFKLFNIN